jgi:hypothetical protein
MKDAEMIVADAAGFFANPAEAGSIRRDARRAIDRRLTNPSSPIPHLSSP